MILFPSLCVVHSVELRTHIQLRTDSRAAFTFHCENQLQSTKYVKCSNECITVDSSIEANIYWCHIQKTFETTIWTDYGILLLPLCALYRTTLFWWKLTGYKLQAAQCLLHQLQQKPTVPAAGAAVCFSWACTVSPAAPPLRSLPLNYWDTEHTHTYTE